MSNIITFAEFIKEIIGAAGWALMLAVGALAWRRIRALKIALKTSEARWSEHVARTESARADSWEEGRRLRDEVVAAQLERERAARAAGVSRGPQVVGVGRGVVPRRPGGPFREVIQDAHAKIVRDAREQNPSDEGLE